VLIPVLIPGALGGKKNLPVRVYTVLTKMSNLFLFDCESRRIGATENARPGKCRTWKMTDQVAGLENARPGK